MADIYPLPGNNITDIVDYTGWVSDTTGGLLMPGIILVAGLVMFLATKRFSAPVAFAISTFLVSILSIIVAIIGWMNPTYMYFSFVLFAFSLLALRSRK